MKKRLFTILASFVLVFALASCGGGDTEGDGGSGGTEPAKIWAGCFQAEIPEGYEANETETEFVSPDNNSQKIKFTFNQNPAEEEITHNLEILSDHVRGDDITVGDYTWLVETFEWNDGAASCVLHLDAGDGEHSLEFYCFELAVDSPEIKAFMESFVLEDDAYNKHVEFLQSTY